MQLILVHPSHWKLKSRAYCILAFMNPPKDKIFKNIIPTFISELRDIKSELHDLKL